MRSTPRGGLRRLGVLVLGLALIGGCPNRLVHVAEPDLQIPEPRRPAAPADARGWYLRALVAEAHGELLEAEHALGWATRLDRSRPWMLLALGAFLERQGRTEEALEATLRAVELAPEEALVQEAAGAALIRAGDDDRARDHLFLAVELGGSHQAFHLLGRLHLRQGDLEAAEALLERWSELEATPGLDALHRGRLALDLERPELAVDDLVLALETDAAPPATGEILADAARRSCRVGTVWSWARRDRVQQQQGEEWRRVALQVGRAAGDVDMVEGALAQESDPVLLRERITRLAAWGRHQEALDVLRAERRDPADGALAIEEGRLLRALGLPEAALAAWSRVPAGSRHAPKALEHRTTLLIDQGLVEDALSLTEHGLDLAPEDRAIRWARALALQAADRLDEAEALAATLGDEVQGARRVAWLRVRRGEIQAALDALIPVAEAGSSLAWREVARLEEGRGEAEEAAAAWGEVVALDPSDAEAWVGLARTSPEHRTAALERALLADPCSTSALIEASRGAPPEVAVELLERAEDTAPFELAVLDALASAYHGQGKHREAREMLLRAIRVQATPQRSRLLDEIGRSEEGR